MLIEIVGQDDAEKHTARQRWAAYRQRGYELKAFDAERRVAL
jgi:DNA polymerase-3 subunit chi